MNYKLIDIILIPDGGGDSYGKMTINLIHLLMAIGIGYAIYAYLRLRAKSVKLKFSEVLYDPLTNEIQLHIENDCSGTMYVSPSIRLVRFQAIDELKDKASSYDSNLPFMTASSASVIKGYDLIGETIDPIQLKGGEKTVLKYPLPEGMKLMVFDTLKIDSFIGSKNDGRIHSVTETLKLNLASNILTDSALGDLDQTSTIDGCIETAGLFQTPFDGGIMASETALDILSKYSGKRKPNTIMESPDDDGDDSLQFELVNSPVIDLKPRHTKILDVLEDETTITAKDLAVALNRKETTVNSDLRFLMKEDLVDRVKIKNTYKYFIVRGQKFIIHSVDSQQVECS